MSACSDGRRASRPTPISDSSCSAASFMTNSTTTRPTNTFAGNAASSGNQAADLGHVPVGAEHNDELEQERHGDEAERLDRPQRARVAQQRRQRPAEVDAIGDRRVGDVEAQRVPHDPANCQNASASLR